MESLSFYSLNCRGLNSTEKEQITDINADIILLQDTYFSEKYENNYNAR